MRHSWRHNGCAKSRYGFPILATRPPTTKELPTSEESISSSWHPAPATDTWHSIHRAALARAERGSFSFQRRHVGTTFIPFPRSGRSLLCPTTELALASTRLYRQKRAS